MKQLTLMLICAATLFAADPTPIRVDELLARRYEEHLYKAQIMSQEAQKMQLQLKLIEAEVRAINEQAKASLAEIYAAAKVPESAYSYDAQGRKLEPKPKEKKEGAK